LRTGYRLSSGPWSSIPKAGLMIRKALESTGIGRNVNVIEQEIGGSRRK
jgi:hypothetical protein